MKTLIPTVYIARKDQAIYPFSSLEAMSEFIGNDTSFQLSKNIVNYGTKSSQKIFVANVSDNELISIFQAQSSVLELDQIAIYAEDLMEAVKAMNENLRSPFVKPETSGLGKLIDLNIPVTPPKLSKTGKDFSILLDSDCLEVPITQALNMASYAKLGKTRMMNEVLEATEESALLLQRFLAWKLNLAGVTDLLKVSAKNLRKVLHDHNQDGFIYMPKKLLEVYVPRCTA